MNSGALARFGAEYARHRAAEGRGHAGDELLSLPYLREGALARQWSVRACTFDAFLRHVLRPLAAERGRPLRLADLGAGSGWLSYRAVLEGHAAVALDIRDDTVDGLGAGAAFVERTGGGVQRVVASFEAVPLPADGVDVAVFNASLHYALDLAAAIGEAARIVAPGGRLVILDSPFYGREQAGLAMVAEKRARAAETFAERADALLALPFVEFLTRARLARASAGLGLRWRRWRVSYPLWYELRPLRAAFKGERAPSRFDLWTSVAL